MTDGAFRGLDRLMNDVAESLIVKHNLRNTHGEVVCWNCLGRVALMPSLHCRDCLQEAKERMGYDVR